VYAILLILVVLFLPRGIATAAGERWRRWQPAAPATPTAGPSPASPGKPTTASQPR
jgi:hypothetical protein